MKKICVLSFLILATLTAVHAQSKSASPANALFNKAEQKLIALNREFVTATSRLDAAVFGRFCADDFTYVSPSGAVLTKAQVLNLYRSISESGKMPTPEALEIDEMTVRIYGDTAVIVSRATLKIHRERPSRRSRRPQHRCLDKTTQKLANRFHDGCNYSSTNVND